MKNIREIIELLGDTIKHGDKQSGRHVIEFWMKEHPYEDVVVKVLEPFLMNIGVTWRQGLLSLAQIYTATKLVEETVELMSSGVEKKTLCIKGPIVIGNAEEDFHSLGRKLVVAFLKANNWAVRDLGNDVLAEDFVDTAIESGSRVIAVSAMMYTTAINIQKIRDMIHRRGLTGQLKLAVGGAVFRLRPQLVGEVGGDGTAQTAMATPALMETLWNQAETKRGVNNDW
ncbi:MAG: cobalamin-dependent protein [Candidatus Magnetoovum sp. WYHC-5]|nr:cobalamin-dependent protein [Candidatus Magnetoovum sp. WYHC-5]